ncbi:uncharacterized protein LOC101861160 [Aplysia californica]|uniref:Uncharacterized protein LOC101861160 n=1 Tax=Aplysia californica TaxID=6500 RepID=A0ABM0K5V8_APLCA|nr:uncharacterized protein LOC101861160 [Aplysia californica]
MAGTSATRLPSVNDECDWEFDLRLIFRNQARQCSIYKGAHGHLKVEELIVICRNLIGENYLGDLEEADTALFLFYPDGSVKKMERHKLLRDCLQSIGGADYISMEHRDVINERQVDTVPVASGLNVSVKRQNNWE